jgi:hypothetical protein
MPLNSLKGVFKGKEKEFVVRNIYLTKEEFLLKKGIPVTL